MKTTIQTPGFKAEPALLDMVENHVEKLGLLSERILEAQVCLTIINSSTQENKRCEIRLVVPGNDLFSAKQRETFLQSVAETCTALRHQVAKWKDAHSSSNQRGVKKALD